MSQDWKDVSRRKPCDYCKGDSWCCVADDGSVVICRRVNNGAALVRTDTHGAEYYVYFANGRRPEVELPSVPGAPLADAGTRDQVYRDLVCRLGLEEKHRDDLRRRGLDDAGIDRHLFRSLPLRGRSEVANELVRRYGADVCAQVPGLYVAEGDRGKYWQLAGSPGLLIPVRNVNGLLVAVRIRPDDPEQDCGKYLWLSSKSKGGPSPGANVHVPFFDGDTSSVRLTEGELKAIVATGLSGVLTLSLPGVSVFAPALPALEQLGAREILLAMDADASRNRHVARALERAAEDLEGLGYRVGLEWWNEEDGKGIDDLLSAGKQPQVSSGGARRTLIAGIVSEAQRQDARGAPKAAAGLDVAGLLETVQERGVAAIFEQAHALAALPVAEYAIVKARLREVLGKKLNLNDLDAAAREARRRTAVRRVLDADNDRPNIYEDGRQYRESIAEAMAALESANAPPVVYVRSGALVQCQHDEAGAPRIRELREAEVRVALSRSANFFQPAGKEGAPPSPVAPSWKLAQGVLALGEWPFPPVVGVTQVPTLRPDGTILDQPGYDPVTRLVYDPQPGLHVPVIPDRPAAEECSAALEIIQELLQDFPFDGNASRTNSIGLMLSLVVRAAIAGHVLMALLDAPQAGTGKGLLAQAVTLIGTGRTVPTMVLPREEDEMRKAITSVLRDGPTAIIADNQEAPLSSPALASALTTELWGDRLLGASETAKLPQRAVWMVTGNNVKLGGDMPRRCYPIRLDAKMARPFQRQGFRHPSLLEWVRAHRGELLAALLTLARAWYAAGKPKPKVTPLGSFEEWTVTVGGILEHAGLEGFLDNLPRMYDSSDEDTPQWEAFLHAWHGAHGEEEVGTARIVEELAAGGPLRDALPDSLAGRKDETEDGYRKRVGKALGKKADVRFGGGIHVARGEKDTRGGRVLWKVIKPEPDKPAADPAPLVPDSASDSAGLQVSQISPRLRIAQDPHTLNAQWGGGPIPAGAAANLRNMETCNGDRGTLRSWAEDHGFPKYRIRGGEEIPAGEEAWDAWLAARKDGQVAYVLGEVSR